MRITLGELAHEIARIFTKTNSRAYPPKEARFIMKVYFREVAKAILNEQEYYFPSKFGTILIIRRSRTKKEILKAGNKSRSKWSLPFDYSFMMKSKRMDEFMYEFKPSKTMGKRLFKEIQKKKRFTTIE